MATIVRMPEISTGSDAAAIAGWLVAVGDEVSAGQPIVEIETEKATVEYEAEAEGTVAGLLLESGTAADVGTPIAVLATGGQSAEEALAEAGTAAEAVPVAEPAPAPVAPTAGAPTLATPISAAPTPAPAVVSAPAADAEASDKGGRLFMSPLVRKLARERGLDLTTVQGTGPGGRIVRRDIDALETGSSDAASPANTDDVRAALPAAAASPQPPAPAAAHAAPSPSTYTDTPNTGMRRAIARRLTESKSTVPHFYLVADCRVDALLTLRAQINALEHTRVSVNDFVVKAVAGALQDVPAANAIWTDEATRTFDSIDIAVAVSVPSGLLTPVVRGVEKLSIGQLSTAIREFAGRARDGKLKQHELEGGSFTVSNLGMYGTREFTAIINPPQSGILAVGAAESRPVVTEEGTLEVATVMTVTLSADHRVLDGALAAEWLAAFQTRIENPMSILI